MALFQMTHEVCEKLYHVKKKSFTFCPQYKMIHHLECHDLMHWILTF